MSPATRLAATQYREVFDRVQDIIYVRDLGGVILDINDAGSRFFGVAKDDVIGRTFHRHVDDDQAQSLKSTNTILLRDGVDRSTVELRNARGELRILESTTTLVRDDAGLPIGAYGVMRDVTDSVRDNERKTRELEEARLVHLALLPKQLPHHPHLDIAVEMRTASEVGGDYYDFVTASDGTLTIALGDATGHGLKSGIFGATAKSYFQTLATQRAPREILQTISAAFRNLGLPAIYMCMLLLRIQERQASVVAAGMPPFFVRRSDGSVEKISVAGTPLGLRRDAFDGTVIDLTPGTTLLLFSDGLPDLHDPDDRELGLDAIASCFAEGGDNAHDILQRVLRMADRWSRGCAAEDDVMLMVIRAI